jgi:acyl-coenzyme A thioesterase PaaI-like protein
MKFSEATAVSQVDSHTYQADFKPEWTIGTVPHGGYVTSVFLTVVRKYFDTTLRQQNQPHTLAAHLDFLRRTQTGPATFKVKDVKLGRQASVVHVALFQDGGREEVIGTFTQANLDAETGVSFHTDWEIHPKPLPVDVSKLETDSDEYWGERKLFPFSDFRKATRCLRFWFPRKGQYSPGIVDQWVALSEEGDKWTNESLGFAADAFPQIIENYLNGVDTYSVAFQKQKGVLASKSRVARMWYPTLLLNLEIKKELPAEGVRFLFVRLQAKAIKNGRYDLELIIKDAEGDLVALSHHVVLAVGSERNTAARRKVESSGSKL